MMKTFILRLYLKLKNRDSIFLGNATIRSRFSGGNYIGKGTVFDGIMGYGSNIGNNCMISGKIGKYTCIGHNVSTVIATHPLAPFVSIHPAFFTTRQAPYERFTDKQIFKEYKYADEINNYGVVIGNDVWIGNNVIIMGGIKIGDGAVIGAGAVVTKDVEPFSINVGIPSKKIKMRFSEQDILFLNKVEWWNKDIKWIRTHSKYFSNIDNLKNVVIKEEINDENQGKDS